ncbi:RNA polymerase sigma factor [Rubellicoccus peritrichatus]|uniref:RNA polymerase sigma factor n=1 Tax=Rubellicoccus peritrichatus TaxID=3080537 RepID=A0AAQ3LFV7_9BACT|nr:RNA polymerase sigma factor [Puniceicoccus sp. CR14]WOO43048.1 RNA polymerase sigma factor [Puniceicoccus sp. CR14]
MMPNFDVHVGDHYRNLYYFALSLSRNEADAADLTQHAYLKLAKHWVKIKNPSKVKSWLFSTLYRDFIDRKRKRKFESDVQIETISREISFESTEAADKHDSEIAVQALIDLQDEYRIPLTLFYLEDYSYKEIAKVLDIPIGTVMSRLHRGKELLYDKLMKKKTRAPFANSSAL